MKILILRFSSIGDIVLTTPVIRTLKQQIPDAEVHYATKAQYEPLLQENPYIDRLHLLGDKMSLLIKAMRKEQFDCIVDLHKNLRTLHIKSELRIKAYTFHKLNLEKYLFTNFNLNLLPNEHIVDRYMKAVQPLGVEMDEGGLDYFIPEKDEVELDWLPQTHRNGYVAVVIGAKFNTKKLPYEQLVSLCDRINKPIVLLGGRGRTGPGRTGGAVFQHSH